MDTALHPDQVDRLRDLLAAKPLASGPGAFNAFTAINKGVLGVRSDSVPPFMSPVVGLWLTYIQSLVPDSVLHSHAWKEAVIQAAQSGRGAIDESLRTGMLQMWTYRIVMPHVLVAREDDERWRMAQMLMGLSPLPPVRPEYPIHLRTVLSYLRQAYYRTHTSGMPPTETAESLVIACNAAIYHLGLVRIEYRLQRGKDGVEAEVPVLIREPYNALWDRLDPATLLSEISRRTSIRDD